MSRQSDQGFILSIDGPVIGIKGLKYQKIGDLVKIGHSKLTGEIIKITDNRSIATCYEYTEGLHVGEPVLNTTEPLSMELGPGLLNNIYDGIQRTLPLLREKYGDFIGIEQEAYALDRKKSWIFEPKVKEGTKVTPGDIIGTVQETNTINHKIMVPMGVYGTLTTIVRPSKYSIEDTIYTIKNGKIEQKFGLFQKWPIRNIRPYRQRIYPTEPLITGMRVIDVLFPVAKGGVVAVPGGFGTGKTVIQHNLAKWADADIIVYVGCGERGNEMADVLEQFPNLIDPHTNLPVMERTVLIANTSNMPVSAREASIFSGLTIAEYYRDMGYDVALLADSTTRWAEALREISGRLEEMPAEGGYPAYLSTRLASFYERAGLVHPLGFPDRVGSITVVGAVSPPSGDFSEPVTKTTRRFVKAFWALDAKLAYSRHYPSISWTDSYSLYSEHLEEWWNKLGKGWGKSRIDISEILARSDELQNIVQLVGKENLPVEQQLILFVAELIKNVYLIQNAFDPIDRYSSPQKSLKLINLILDYYSRSLDVVSREIPLFEVENLGIVTEISRARLSIKNKDVDQFEGLQKKLEREITGLIERYESS
ncbi:MAG: V-type ATP synthase subunit A [Candidatus Lokiarchaeota archaeon]|nr:V-type ATP synthase subunit A [Candidatus Lokiarchaeota archaeon]